MTSRALLLALLPVAACVSTPAPAMPDLAVAPVVDAAIGPDLSGGGPCQTSADCPASDQICNRSATGARSCGPPPATPWGCNTFELCDGDCLASGASGCHCADRSTTQATDLFQAAFQCIAKACMTENYCTSGFGNGPAGSCPGCLESHGLNTLRGLPCPTPTGHACDTSACMAAITSCLSDLP